MIKNPLSLIYALALSAGMVLVLMLGAETPVEARTVCPLPKVLVRLEVPNGDIKRVCVPPHVAASIGGKSGKGADPAGVSDGTSLATELFSAAVSGVTSEAAGAAGGWVLGALGLTSGNGASEQTTILNNISDELGDIENTLTNMLAEINNIDQAIKIQTCDDFIGSTGPARTLIDSLTTNYNNFLTDATGTNFTPPTVPPIDDCASSGPGACLKNWANAVLDDSTTTSGILNAVNQIHEAMIAAGNEGGIITSCLNTTLLTPPQTGENDVDYYDSVATLMTAFYNYQARGLLLLVEANHFVAWSVNMPGGDPSTDPSSTSDICTMATSSEVVNACNAALTATATVHANLKAQYVLAGAPYIAADTADSYLLDYTAEGEATLWVKSLEDFNNAVGFNCASPLTSADPCGVTVGNASSSFNSFGAGFGFYDPYGAWRPATAPELSLLLGGQGQTQTPGEFLGSLGFENMTNKVVITGNTTDFSIISQSDLEGLIDPYTGSAVCFMDTDIPNSLMSQPMCSSGGVNDLWNVNGVAFVSCAGLMMEWQTIGTNGSLPGSRNGFYDLSLVPKTGQHQTPCPYDVVVAPGWSMSNTGSNANQYRWPALSLTDIPCTENRSQTNASGVAFTRCGADFDAWFETIAPSLTPPVSFEKTMLPGPDGPAVCTANTSHWNITIGDFTLWWQSDGNLVLYQSGASVWATNTSDIGADELCWQGDGNLVIYLSGQPVWASNTADTEHGGNGGRLLTLSSNGLLQITDETGYTLFHQGPFE